ncbi:hypothetical protein [Actinomadura litoris]|uniref:hypothetical protein n=1 Tax=Actinomadura litoris TaxID=2678616 RepID=UPI001FA7C870|nr:hypothetical protein [Actinomadura litoris]
MQRHWFGGTPADWTFTASENNTVMLAGGATVTWWSARGGGVQYTDHLTEDGTPITTVTSGDGTTAPVGTISRFQGPPDVLGMWGDAGGGDRFWMPATDVAETLQAHTTADDPHGDRLFARQYTDAAIAALPPSGPGGGSPTVPGLVALESFTGTTWDAKFAAALAYAAAQTYKPTIALPIGSIDLSGGPYTFFDGLRLSGSVGAGDREFAAKGPQSIVNVTGAPALFQMPTTDVSNMYFRGVQFRTNTNADWMVRGTDFANGQIMKDVSFSDLAWVGFASIMHARHLRVSIQRMYANNGSDVQFRLSGSDNYYWTEGASYLSGDVPATAPAYIYFASMSRTRVGPIEITPQYATAIRIEGGLGGLSLDGVLFDGTGRTKTTACQGAALFIHSGEGHTFRNLWFFNNCVSPSSTTRIGEAGQVFIKSGAANILFSGCQWSGGNKQAVVTPPGTPAIYCQAGVTNVRVTDPLAPNGGERKLEQATTGALICNDPNWSIVTAT